MGLISAGLKNLFFLFSKKTKQKKLLFSLKNLQPFVFFVFLISDDRYQILTFEYVMISEYQLL